MSCIFISNNTEIPRSCCNTKMHTIFTIKVHLHVTPFTFFYCILSYFFKIWFFFAIFRFDFALKSITQILNGHWSCHIEFFALWTIDTTTWISGLHMHVVSCSHVSLTAFELLQYIKHHISLLDLGGVIKHDRYNGDTAAYRGNIFCTKNLWALRVKLTNIKLFIFGHFSSLLMMIMYMAESYFYIWI